MGLGVSTKDRERAESESQLYSRQSTLKETSHQLGLWVWLARRMGEGVIIFLHIGSADLF